ncbi:uncharacterized protein LOC142985137 isoform X2 [Anticarsia gemmatalis]|uniref:uncharacterized protein LOC142985137 isoform X2 n=1 Tax=Anticarsia gemmatalis TaxID=129554 RepID=UPI003F75B926
MRRDNISPKSCLYCCEDHFNVKEDTENYIQYNLMKEQGEKCSLRLKKGVLPHIFLCQKRRMPLPKERMAAVKMQRLTLVNEALSSEIAIKSSVSEPSQRSDDEVSPSTSHTNVCDEPGCSTSRRCDDLQECSKPTFKYCIVPLCKNTNKNAPNKVFFLVPRGAAVRKTWCRIMKRDMISPSTCLYCCEDHFDLEEDTANYIEYKIMNLQENHKTVLRLKKGILPHKFQCQKDTETQPSLERKAYKKRKHKEIIEVSLSAPPAKQSVSTTKLTDLSQIDQMEASTSASSSQLPNDMENYMKYRLMGSVSQIRMKPGCLPSKFTCHTKKGKQTATKRGSTVKKRRKVLIEECEETEYLEFEEPTCESSGLKFVVDVIKEEVLETEPLEEALRPDCVLEPIEDLKNYHQHKLMNQEPRLKPTASFCRGVTNKSKHVSELPELSLQQAKTCSQKKRKYDDSMPRTSSFSSPVKELCSLLQPNAAILPATSQENSVYNEKAPETSKETIPESKTIIGNVYRFLSEEYERLRSVLHDEVLTTLCDVTRRTASATGVTERVLATILTELGIKHGSLEESISDENTVHEHDIEVKEEIFETSDQKDTIIIETEIQEPFQPAIQNDLKNSNITVLTHKPKQKPGSHKTATHKSSASSIATTSTKAKHKESFTSSRAKKQKLDTQTQDKSTDVLQNLLRNCDTQEDDDMTSETGEEEPEIKLEPGGEFALDIYEHDPLDTKLSKGIRVGDEDVKMEYLSDDT